MLYFISENLLSLLLILEVRHFINILIFPFIYSFQFEIHFQFAAVATYYAGRWENSVKLEENTQKNSVK